MRRKLLAFGGGLTLTALLLLDLSGGVLAHPEQPGTAQDRFVGFHLVYEPAPTPGEGRSVEDAHWVEYGTQTLDAGPYGSVSLPQKVLPGEEQEDGTYRFPGKEGLNFFFPTLSDGSEEVLLSESQLEMTEQAIKVDDLGTSYNYSGTLCYGPRIGEQEAGEDFCWTAYEVYQGADGTVYLNGHGSSYSGGGDFGFSQTRSETERINGAVTQQLTLALSVDVHLIPRPDSVSIQQYSQDQRLLREDTLTAGEAMDLGGIWTLPWVEGTAYTLAVKHNSVGTRTFELFPEPYQEDRATSLTVWFLDDQGMGVPITVELERSAPA